jgi:hypothetical protein
MAAAEGHPHPQHLTLSRQFEYGWQLQLHALQQERLCEQLRW